MPTQSITPLHLQLFDGTSNQVITRTATLPFHFPSGKVISVDCYVTPLDKLVSAVLGYSWLHDYNLLIDWRKHSIQSRTTPLTRPVSEPVPTPSAQASLSEHPVSTSAPSAPRVSLIGAAAFARACKLPGSTSFTLSLVITAVNNGRPGGQL